MFTSHREEGKSNPTKPGFPYDVVRHGAHSKGCNKDTARDQATAQG
jgi:hypothetical protein